MIQPILTISISVTEQLKQQALRLHDDILNYRETQTEVVLTELFKSWMWNLFYKYIYDKEEITNQPWKYPNLIDVDNVVLYGEKVLVVCGLVFNPFHGTITIDNQHYLAFLSMYNEYNWVDEIVSDKDKELYIAVCTKKDTLHDLFNTEAEAISFVDDYYSEYKHIPEWLNTDSGLVCGAWKVIKLK